jgi:hypothetical protein
MGSDVKGEPSAYAGVRCKRQLKKGGPGMSYLGMKLTRMMAVGALAMTSLVVAAPMTQAATVLEGPGHALSSSVLFDTGSTVLKPAIQARLQAMLSQVPAKPWHVYITVSTSEAVQVGAGHRVALARVAGVVTYWKSRLEAAGATVFVSTTTWFQPGYTPRYIKNLRYVFTDLNW